MASMRIRQGERICIIGRVKQRLAKGSWRTAKARSWEWITAPRAICGTVLGVRKIDGGDFAIISSGRGDRQQIFAAPPFTLERPK